MSSPSQASFVHKPSEDVHYLFNQAFKDEEFRQKLAGEDFSLDKCLAEAVASVERAGWSFGGRDKTLVDSDWLAKLMSLCQAETTRAERLSHLMKMQSALGEYREEIKIMGKAYWLPRELIPLIRYRRDI